MFKPFYRFFSFFFHKHPKFTSLGLIIIFLVYWFALPYPLFKDPVSFVLEDEKEYLLGARIAKDGQWRFPKTKHLPDKFKTAIIEFEDRRFEKHWGIDLKGIIRAFYQNITNRKIVSGGSTITMQVIRMARKKKSRNILNKVIEIILSTRLELSYSKDDILKLYATNAPFGGNVVGLDAASWRYYGKAPSLLSWAEAATLAVLPNSPALIHPGRNRNALEAKRNRLLKRLYDKSAIDETSYRLALEEPLPDKPLPLPNIAPHLLDRAKIEQTESRVKTTIKNDLQQKVSKIVEKHHRFQANNGINNIATFIMEVESGNVIAYVGNVIRAGEEHGEQVDIITAPRSTGSILKPFLYALALEEGLILPKSLLSDVPTSLSGYRPKNYLETYDGAVPSNKAISRSLNIPSINLLSKYGLSKFHFKLQKLGISTLHRSPDDYGLPLVLGGAEGKLWEITSIYASMARVLNHFYDNDSKYNLADWHKPNYIFNHKMNTSDKLVNSPTLLGAASIYWAFQAMLNVERPDTEGNWEVFSSTKKIAWKTGTSFGFRDAWAVGVTPKYAVGVWVGNADGEGRPGLVGVKAAAPILFDIFKSLKTNKSFDVPYDEMVEIPVCGQSGYRALKTCTPIDTQWVQITGLKSESCPYHRIVHLDETEQFQVNINCEHSENIKHLSWFVLPPIQEYYYKYKNPSYKLLPPFRKDCNIERSTSPMQLIYPKYPSKIYIPKDLDGEYSRTVFNVAHRDSEEIIYWHLNNEYIGETTHFHEMELNPQAGQYILTLVDSKGNRLEQKFEIIEKDVKKPASQEGR